MFRAGTEIVSRAARDRVQHYLNSLKQYFAGLTFLTFIITFTESNKFINIFIILLSLVLLQYSNNQSINQKL